MPSREFVQSFPRNDVHGLFLALGLFLHSFIPIQSFPDMLVKLGSGSPDGQEKDNETP